MSLIGRTTSVMSLLLRFGIFVSLPFFAVVSCSESAVSQDRFELPESASTFADFRKSDFLFRMRELEAYQKLTKDPLPARKVVQEFLEISISNASFEYELEHPLVARADELASLGRAAIKAGAIDPIFRSHYARVIFEENRIAEAVVMAEESFLEFKKHERYPSEMQMFLLERMKAINKANANPWRISRFYGVAHSAMPAWFVWAMEKPNSQRSALQIFEIASETKRSRDPNQHENAVKRYGNLTEKDPWLWEMIKGISHSDAAWYFRGTGFPGSVSSARWESFQTRSRMASRHFRAAYKLDPTKPESAANLIPIAMTGHEPESTWTWFNRSVKAEIDHPPAYRRLRHSLLPNWGGGTTELLDFGEQCFQSQRFDTDIPLELFNAALAVVSLDPSNGGETWKDLLERPGFYEKLIYACDTLSESPHRQSSSKDPADSLSKSETMFLTIKLALAIKADQFGDAYGAWQRLGDQADKHWLGRFGISSTKYMRSRNAAYFEHGETLLRLRALMYPEQISLADNRKLLQAIEDLVQENQNDEGLFYLQCRVSVAQIEIDFAEGKWVDLDFDPEFVMWKGNQQHWAYESPSSMLVTNRSGPSMTLTHEARFPGPREIHVDTEVLDIESKFFRLGITMGNQRVSKNGLMFNWEPVQRAFLVSDRIRDLGNTYATHPCGQLRVRCWGGAHFEFLADDNFAMSSTSAPNHHPTAQISIGTCRKTTIAGSARFKNVRIRKLKIPAPPGKANAKALIDYYTDRIEHEPNYHPCYALRANAFAANKQRIEASEDYGRYMELAPGDDAMRCKWAFELCLSGQYAEGVRQFESALKSGNEAEGNLFTDHFAALNLAYWLSMIPDKKLRDGKRSLKMVENLPTYIRQRMSFWWVSKAMAHLELRQFAEAAVALDGAKSLDRDDDSIAELRPYVATKKPFRHIFEKPTTSPKDPQVEDPQADAPKRAPEDLVDHTVFKLTPQPQRSSKSTADSSIMRTIDDQSFVYRPWFPKSDMPVQKLSKPYSRSAIKPGFHGSEPKGKQVRLSYAIQEGVKVGDQQPTFVVDLYGRSNIEKVGKRDNDIDVILFNGNREIARMNHVQIPDKGSAHFQAKWESLSGKTIDRIEVISHHSAADKNYFSLMEIRAASMSAITLQKRSVTSQSK